ncbi:MAG TPA: ergothioneine biosynthesis protein EgtB [Candidatus Saccharimonadales bacterium]|nr:ergothioneine biosynthesis protein EgtB [Candidatus Saccharimonadales bacterium]
MEGFGLATITSGTFPIHFGASLLQRFQQVRSTTMRLAEPLSEEDAMVQSMPDASPSKWHMAHTTWFFETFILSGQVSGYRIFNPEYRLLFNSYYKALGGHPVRQQRGTFSRPSFSNVVRYREHVDEAMQRLLATDPSPEVLAFIELGINHEQQHQELLLTDILHAFWTQPLRPAYAPPAPDGMESTGAPSLPSFGRGGSASKPRQWISHPGGTFEMGAPDDIFAFDNERPRFHTFLAPYRLASRLATNAEYLEFIKDRGYQRPELWLSDGWDTVCREGWRAPLYWEGKGEGEWHEFSLRGMNPLNPAAPVNHVSYYEADAFARWSGARLPLETEWEQAAKHRAIAGNLLEDFALDARPSTSNTSPEEDQLFGDLWEWTGSAYLPYPGFRPAPGAVGEYNGKFMCNQFILRGGSFATSASHIRASYRNFFPPHVRWQFMGIRLADNER